MRPIVRLLLVSLVAGCSSGSSGSTAPGPTSTLTISSLDADDGTLTGTLTRGVIANCCGFSGGIYVGQASASASFVTFVPGIARGFVRFNLALLPAGATIVSATVKTVQISAGSMASADPYAVLGNVVLDHPDFGAVIDTLDFATAPLVPQTVTLSADYTKEQKTADVTAFVQADVAARRGHTDLRIRFATETLPAAQNSGRGTFFTESSGIISGTGPAPQLVITYR
jgi:hypothetical protein